MSHHSKTWDEFFPRAGISELLGNDKFEALSTVSATEAARDLVEFKTGRWVMTLKRQHLLILNQQTCNTVKNLKFLSNTGTEFA